MTEQAPASWHDDLLDYAKIGGAFTNLIKSINDSKVISIEASFGQGKTYFRRNWAAQLRAAGEVVIEFDAQEADRTGDPLITLLGAMIRHVPQGDKEKWKKVGSTAMAMGGLAARSIAKMVLRNAADEVISAVQKLLDARLPENEILDKTMSDIGGDLSKYTAGIISSQLAAEKAVQELPAQLDALKTALASEGRIVVLIDELDRCHPEYAIALLEAMKLVFNRKGFVFCLMVNPQYLENIAQHRFGLKIEGEAYLDKFIDIRLALKPSRESIETATTNLVARLPLAIPFAVHHEFSVERAADLAGKLAKDSSLSIRQIKHTIGTVELALRCYAALPIDCPLLVALAITNTVQRTRGVHEAITIRNATHNLLPRAKLSKQEVLNLMDRIEKDTTPRGDGSSAAQRFIRENCRELLDLDVSRYPGIPARAENGRNWHNWYQLLAGLGPTYIESHESMLAMVHELQAGAP